MSNLERQAYEALRIARSILQGNRDSHLDDEIHDAIAACERSFATEIDHGVAFATVRMTDGDDMHIECRFSDGQKYAPIKVDADHPEIAHWIAAKLSDGRAPPNNEKAYG